MTAASGTHPDFRHVLLVHDNDEQLFEGIRAFVDEGLTSGGDVMVLGTRERLGLLRELIGSDSRLDYGCVEELYLAPMRTLFDFQRMLAERTGPTVLWVTGSVPLGRDSVAQAAWDRYESAVNEALSVYPFRGLCAYDTRTRPAPVIEAARATHPTVSIDLTNRASPEYVDPAAFLAGPLARVPAPPTSSPDVNTTVAHLHDLMWARSLLEAGARCGSAVSYQTIEQCLMAVQEVAANGLFHGGSPVRITLWADVGALFCLVEDSGSGGLDPMTGFRFPDESGPMGLWAARQLVDDLFIGSSPSGGCSVLLIAT